MKRRFRGIAADGDLLLARYSEHPRRQAFFFPKCGSTFGTSQGSMLVHAPDYEVVESWGRSSVIPPFRPLDKYVDRRCGMNKWNELHAAFDRVYGFGDHKKSARTQPGT